MSSLCYFGNILMVSGAGIALIGGIMHYYNNRYLDNNKNNVQNFSTQEETPQVTPEETQKTHENTM